MNIEEKKLLLIEMEKWYRKEHQKRDRIGDISTDSIFPFFEKKYNFTHEPKHCRVCNKKLIGKHYRYCSDGCRETANMFSWQSVKQLFSELNSNFTCKFCGSNGDIDVDHIRPISKGGLEFDLNNLRYLCQHCNRSRKLKHHMVIYPPREISSKIFFERQKTLKDKDIIR